MGPFATRALKAAIRSSSCAVAGGRQETKKFDLKKLMRCAVQVRIHAARAAQPMAFPALTHLGLQGRHLLLRLLLLQQHPVALLAVPPALPGCSRESNKTADVSWFWDSMGLTSCLFGVMLPSFAHLEVACIAEHYVSCRI